MAAYNIFSKDFLGPRDSTLYPRITVHIKDVVKRLHEKLRDPDNPDQELVLEPIDIIGTVKVHGTHADILIYHDNTIVFQSRNNPVLTESADNLGFVASMAQNHAAILRLRDQYLARWSAHNPSLTLNTSLPVTLSGEWIGSKIQKHVAVAQLSRRLVLFSAKINGAWVDDRLYADMEAPSASIYNIARAGSFTATLYPENPQRTADELAPLTERVAAHCPFAAGFGAHGEGEGLVWKPIPYLDDPDLWFKTKGGRFKPTFTPAPRRPAGGGEQSKKEKWEAAAAVARAWCGEQRLEQGWDFLREKDVQKDMRALGGFLKWVQQDVLTEERGFIREHGVDEEMLRKEVIGIAKPWYVERYSAEK